MVRDRLTKVAVSLLLLHASSLASSCSKSSGTLNDVGFSCESDPTPSRVGLNTFTVTLTAGGGERLTGAHISLEGDMTHAGMSPVVSEAKEIAPGRYQGTLDITLPGGRTFDRQMILRNIQAT
jgi:hypothetical protein